MIIESGLTGDDLDSDRLQTEAGRDGLQSYSGRIAQWVIAPVPDAEPSDAEMARLFGPSPETQPD